MVELGEHDGGHLRFLLPGRFLPDFNIRRELLPLEHAEEHMVRAVLLGGPVLPEGENQKREQQTNQQQRNEPAHLIPLMGLRVKDILCVGTRSVKLYLKVFLFMPSPPITIMGKGRTFPKPLALLSARPQPWYTGRMILALCLLLFSFNEPHQVDMERERTCDFAALV
jgi:hypothetical protein